MLFVKSSLNQSYYMNELKGGKQDNKGLLFFDKIDSE